MPFNFLNQGQSGDVTEFKPIDTFIDPVSKIRVSNPGNLIDTDFEYGLQPTKWETVEIINNTPAFFSKSGDTTISDITGITTNSGTREITVTTAFPHNLAVGIPIRVSGTKSVTADGSYIINATPTPNTFTYLSRANESETVSIFDLYSSIITGEFFQGSQIGISDSEGITTDGVGPRSTLTVKTSNKHGFGPKTPFYFLNLNSTVSKEFEAQNTTSLSFDPTNSATAQAFDGSNTLLQTPIDLSNSATTSESENSITSTDAVNATITVSIQPENETAWSELVLGSPLYYSVNIGSGYFQENPRGVVFIKDVSGVNIAIEEGDSSTATFQVSALPDGDPLPILSNMTGFFQVADQARTFPGNNVNPETQIDINIFEGESFVFDGGNQGYDGEPENPPNNEATVTGYTSENILLFTSEGSLDYYVGAMLLYSTDGTAATGLQNNSTYFVTAFSDGPSAGLFNISIAELPGGDNLNISGGDGVQTFSKIGVSLDKDIVHVKNSNFVKGDMLEYTYPSVGVAGNFGADQEKDFYFVATAYDAHNYVINSVAESFISATGGDVIQTLQDFGGRDYTVHRFTTSGTFQFEVTDAGTFDQEIKYVVDGGSFDGATSDGSFTSATGTYTVVVNSGGQVDIAYPQDGETNDITFATINPVPISATGGSISSTNVNGIEYRVHQFASVGTSTFSVGSAGNFGDGKVEYLVIAGGGGGASGGGNDWYKGGGGGAGGYRSSVAGEVSGGNSPAETPFVVEPNTDYTVVVGNGGAYGGSTASQGGNSSFADIVSIGGGRGSRGGGGGGGSGGGSGASSYTGNGTRPGGPATAGQGNDGGLAYSSSSTERQRNAGAGGGGAGTAGGNGGTGNGARGGNGGNGLASVITGSSVTRAGGGGGSSYNTAGSGGSGGGGNGARRNGTGGSGQNNTGSGGGGSADGGRGGNGGSGIVILRYPLEPNPEEGGL